ncbi:MAG: zinc ribbon domain-containing protein [Candidatus Acidiferrales bacterium]
MFCVHCGATMERQHRFCAACGKQSSASAAQPAGYAGPAAAATQSSTARHLPILGVLWVLRGSLRLLGSIAALFVGAAMLPWMAGEFGFPMESFWKGFLPGLIAIGAWLNGAVGGASIAAGYGLMQREPWGRTLALVMGLLALLSVPFGTALGIYTLIVLLPARSEAEYRQLARAV